MAKISIHDARKKLSDRLEIIKKKGLEEIKGVRKGLLDKLLGRFLTSPLHGIEMLKYDAYAELQNYRNLDEEILEKIIEKYEKKAQKIVIDAKSRIRGRKI